MYDWYRDEVQLAKCPHEFDAGFIIGGTQIKDNCATVTRTLLDNRVRIYLTDNRVSELTVYVPHGFEFRLEANINFKFTHKTYLQVTELYLLWFNVC